MPDQKIVETDPQLKIQDLHTYIGESHILQGCSLVVGQECVALLGRNGMGKTTLLRSIMGLTPPRRGKIEWKQELLNEMRPNKIANLGIGYVPQGRRLVPSLSVEEHLTLLYRKIDSPSAWTPERVFNFFPELADRKKISGTRLSGGEQQMLAIGRALVTNPDILLLDEPSEGLSPVANDRVIEICHELLKAGISILLVEQNIHVAEALAERIYIILGGRTVHESAAHEFLGDTNLRQKYLGI
jgi:branched-chain amino acid transport system ATP-binding protein